SRGSRTRSGACSAEIPLRRAGRPGTPPQASRSEGTRTAEPPDAAFRTFACPDRLSRPSARRRRAPRPVRPRGALLPAAELARERHPPGRRRLYLLPHLGLPHHALGAAEAPQPELRLRRLFLRPLLPHLRRLRAGADPRRRARLDHRRRARLPVAARLQPADLARQSRDAAGLPRVPGAAPPRRSGPGVDG